MHHPLMCFSLAFGICPSRSSLGCELGLPCGRPSLRRPLAKPSTASTPSSRSSVHTHRWAARRHCVDASCSWTTSRRSPCHMPRLRAAACRAQAHLPSGPCDAYRCPLARPPRAALRQLADRPGLPPPALLVACICQPYFMLDRPWAPTLQRLLPVRAVFIAEGPPCGGLHATADYPPCRFPSSHRPPALRQTACGPTSRLRGFKLDSLGAPCGTPGYPNGCVLRRRRCSRPRRVAPLMVVSPLRG